MSDKEHEIRERAYSIWEEQGKPEGQHETHWDVALKELGIKDLADTTAITSGAVESSSPIPPPAAKGRKSAKAK